MRLGLFGGTFDPVHVGHLVAAVNARHALCLDRLLLVVANEPWQKTANRPLTPALDRLAMVDAAVEGHEGLEASAMEIERGGLSYTADTVNQLAEAGSSTEIFLLVGADVVAGLDTWERVEEIRPLVTLVAVNRPGAETVELGEDGPLAGWKACTIEIPDLEISSTDLRDRARAGRPLDYLVPEAAIRVIRDRRLYAERG